MTNENLIRAITDELQRAPYPALRFVYAFLIS